MQQRTENEMCNYQGYEFGAGRYPDSVCIDGKLHDADACDGEGNIYLQEEDIPCPICRPSEAIDWWAERNALSVRDDETDEQAEARARANAISLVNDIRANRGFAAAA